MALNGYRVPPPPREINVQAFAGSRAPELKSLHAIVSARANHDFREPRGKRRRTNSHDTRIAGRGRGGRKRRRLGGGETVGAEEKKKDAKEEYMSRRMRRRLEFKENPVSGYVVSADGTKRMRTHLWHAKRFAMVKKWGFFLPLGLQGRGRGSRAVLKWMKNGAVIHDASYFNPVQLEGPKESLLAVMKKVLVLSPSDVQEEASRLIVGGVCHGSAFLHHVGSQDSQFIAPVIYMWRPSCKNHLNNDVEKENHSNSHGMQGEDEVNVPIHQLWIWLHAAAFNEGYDALSSASSELTNESDVSISCLSAMGQLANFEIMGAKAVDVLNKILHPLPESCSPVSVLRKCTHLTHCMTSQVKKSDVLEHIEHIPCRSVLSLEVHDPRDLHSDAVKTHHDSHSLKHDGHLERGETDQTDFSEPRALNVTKETVLALWTNQDQNGATISDNELLWVSRDKVKLPVKESMICTKKNEKRLKFFKLDRSDVLPLNSNDGEATSSSCPVLLIRRGNQRNNFTCWSLILPLCWSKAFWVSLVSSGAHVIGLRERRWIACDNGLPCFPYDFPDSKAYSLSMAAEAAEFDQASELRPLSMQPMKVPIPPPWDCVRHTVMEKTMVNEDSQTVELKFCGREIIQAGSVPDFEQDDCLAVFPESGLSFIGSVARTSDAIQMPRRRKLCFVRVFLHAYKEGVFEGGAVVCAPAVDDISMWISRSEDQEKLQIPQSSVKSYFVEKNPGCWELQMSNCTSIQKSDNHRWPIGFVTTGFVRGSSKAVAEALCEANLLAELRCQQQNVMQEKERLKVFVLVRNLRSTAYRLGIATVVLEQQEDDLEFV